MSSSRRIYIKSGQDDLMTNVPQWLGMLLGGEAQWTLAHGQNANTPFFVAHAEVSSFPMCLLLW